MSLEKNIKEIFIPIDQRPQSEFNFAFYCRDAVLGNSSRSGFFIHFWNRFAFRDIDLHPSPDREEIKL